MVKCPQCGNSHAIIEEDKVKCNICGFNITAEDIRSWENNRECKELAESLEKMR